MDLVTVLVVLSLIGFGGSVVYWGLSWEISILKDELEDAQFRERALLSAAQRVVFGEHEIDAARDLAPLDELRMLLGTSYYPPSPEASGDQDHHEGLDVLPHDGLGDPPPLGTTTAPGEQEALDQLRKALGGPQ